MKQAIVARWSDEKSMNPSDVIVIVKGGEGGDCLVINEDIDLFNKFNIGPEVISRNNSEYWSCVENIYGNEQNRVHFPRELLTKVVERFNSFDIGVTLMHLHEDNIIVYRQEIEGE